MGDKRKKLQIAMVVILVVAGMLLIGFNIARAIVTIPSMDEQNESIPIVFLNSTNTNLSLGKNIVYFDNYFTAKGIVKLNKDIETISYYDEMTDKTVGYVNVFGGIGKDFTIYPGKAYEINTKRQISLIFK